MRRRICGIGFLLRTLSPRRMVSELIDFPHLVKQRYQYPRNDITIPEALIIPLRWNNLSCQRLIRWEQQIHLCKQHRAQPTSSLPCEGNTKHINWLRIISPKRLIKGDHRSFASCKRRIVREICLYLVFTRRVYRAMWYRHTRGEV